MSQLSLARTRWPLSFSLSLSQSLNFTKALLKISWHSHNDSCSFLPLCSYFIYYISTNFKPFSRKWAHNTILCQYFVFLAGFWRINVRERDSIEHAAVAALIRILMFNLLPIVLCCAHSSTYALLCFRSACNPTTKLNLNHFVFWCRYTT